MRLGETLGDPFIPTPYSVLVPTPRHETRTSRKLARLCLNRVEKQDISALIPTVEV